MNEPIERDKTSMQLRVFDTGAVRDQDKTKLDYEGFLSPIVLEAYAKYMNRHLHLADGSTRASDNWQKGLPRDVYMKSMFRHFMEVWSTHRGSRDEHKLEEQLCALLFNVMGYLFEILKPRYEIVKSK
jgi:hypothetical protein